MKRGCLPELVIAALFIALFALMVSRISDAIAFG